jgi:hypothetical protein
VDRREFTLRIVQGAGQRADAFEPELHRQRFVSQAVKIFGRFFKIHHLQIIRESASDTDFRKYGAALQ